MSIAEIERLAADLKSNPALRAEAEKAEAGKVPETPLADVIAFAATKGYAITAGDMTEYVKAKAHAAGVELSDAELGSVVAGTGENPDLVAFMQKMQTQGDNRWGEHEAEKQRLTQDMRDKAAASHPGPKGNGGVQFIIGSSSTG